MKRTITTIAAALICWMASVSTAVLADDEVKPTSGRSPLLPNFYPAAGHWISETNYSEVKLTLNSSWSTQLQKVEQSLRYGITDQTEVVVAQPYAIKTNIEELGDFYNPLIGIEHRLDISDSENIYAVGLSIRPELSYAGYQPSLKQQQIFSKLSWKLGSNLWLGLQGKYTNTQQNTIVSTSEDFSIQFNVSSSWDATSALFTIGLSKTPDFIARVLYRNPIALSSIESEISPIATTSISHRFGNSLYGIFDFSWQSRKYSITYLGQYQNLGSSINTTVIQTVTARLLKEF